MASAINSRSLSELASKNATSTTVEKVGKVSEKIEEWKERMFAINISWNGRTGLDKNVLPDLSSKNAEVNLRILFSL